MTTALHQDTWEWLLTAWEALDAPEGSKVEIVQGELTVSPPPDMPHNLTADALNDLLVPRKPAGAGLFQTLALAVPSIQNLFIPDLVVYPRDEIPASGHSAPSEHALLVVEITSPSNPEHDRTTKVSGYAAGRVPLYLLIDRYDRNGPTVTLHAEPRGGVYQYVHRFVFGQPVPLPAPFGFEVDTKRFMD